MCQICGMAGLNRSYAATSVSGSQGERVYENVQEVFSFAGEPRAGGAAGSGVTIVAPTGNTFTDGVLAGFRWTNSALTYSFPTLASQYENTVTQAQNNFTAASAALQAATIAAFDQVASFTGLTFSLAATPGTATFRTAVSGQPPTAEAFYPGTDANAGDMWYGTGTPAFQTPQFSGYAWTTILHELGHALGLKHSHEAENGFPVLPSQQDYMPFSLMSYRSFRDGTTAGGYTNEEFGYAQTFMMADIRGLQHMYGANYNTNAGDTVYRWSETTGQMSLNGSTAGQSTPGANRVFMTIWDGNGNDTYDFSNYGGGITADLRPGRYSLTTEEQRANLGSNNLSPGNVFNTFLYQEDARSLIENAIGGAGNDTITGNIAANTLTGNGGNDTLTGDTGNDTFVYSAGADIITDFVAAGTDDRINLVGLGNFANLAAVIAIGVQTGANSVFTFSAGNTLTLNNVTLTALTVADFVVNGMAFGPVVNTVTGTAGADSLTGTTGIDDITGLGGNDTIDGRGGGDTIAGGDNDDTIYYYATDTAENITGGNGTDTLLVISGTAPTGFGLTAQGFEGARHDQTDTGNAQPWNTITDTYNATWQVLTTNRVNDDATRRVTTYDRANTQTWASSEEDYNAAGQRYELRTYYDDTTRRTTGYDVTNAQPYATYEEDYNVAGQRVALRTYYDDNTRRTTGYDPTNAVTWNTYEEDYNVAGQRVALRTYNDDNTRRTTQWDPANAVNWSLIEEYFNAAGTRFRQITDYDDGDNTRARLDTSWDVGNTQAWSVQTTQTNNLGVVVRVYGTLDNGTAFG